MFNRQDVSGFVFTLSNAAISWKSQKQESVALSSTEYMSISEPVKEAIHLRSFMKELRLQDLEDITVFNDNRGAKLIAENHVFHQRTKLA